MHIWSMIRRIKIVRVQVANRPSTLKQIAWRRHAVLVVSVVAMGGFLAAPALAANSGSGTATINVAPAVLSVSVSPSTFNLCPTGSPLTIPNGSCAFGTLPSTGQSVGGVLVTNTGVAGHIDSNGANAVPSDSGTPWTLCVPFANCGSASANPGANQFTIQTDGFYNGAGVSGYDTNDLTNTPACDDTFSAGGTTAGSCSAAHGASEDEQVNIFGPASSTDTSSVFTTVLTWTAVP
jgi:hypothetical protein